MKRLGVFILILFAGLNVQAQVLSKSELRQQNKMTSTFDEDFKITIELSLTAVEFDRYDRSLDTDLEQKIRTFFEKPHQNFPQTGKFEIRIVKKQGAYFIAQGSGYSRELFKLE